MAAMREGTIGEPVLGSGGYHWRGGAPFGQGGSTMPVARRVASVDSMVGRVSPLASTTCLALATGGRASASRTVLLEVEAQVERRAARVTRASCPSHQPHRKRRAYSNRWLNHQRSRRGSIA